MRISDWSSDVCSSDLRQFDHFPDLVDRHPEAAQIVIGHVRAPGFLGLFILGAKLDFRFGRDLDDALWRSGDRSEEHTSELQSLMRISYAVFCLKKKNQIYQNYQTQ